MHGVFIVFQIVCDFKLSMKATLDVTDLLETSTSWLLINVMDSSFISDTSEIKQLLKLNVIMLSSYDIVNNESYLLN